MLYTIEKHINTITSLISTEQHRPLNFQIHKQVPPNKLLKPQRPFISTRKSQPQGLPNQTSKNDFIINKKQTSVLVTTRITL